MEGGIKEGKKGGKEERENKSATKISDKHHSGT